jgi:hypothetical protein
VSGRGFVDVATQQRTCRLSGVLVQGSYSRACLLACSCACSPTCLFTNAQVAISTPKDVPTAVARGPTP